VNIALATRCVDLPMGDTNGSSDITVNEIIQAVGLRAEWKSEVAVSRQRSAISWEGN
jgi:hypothetical protein